MHEHGESIVQRTIAFNAVTLLVSVMNYSMPLSREVANPTAFQVPGKGGLHLVWGMLNTSYCGVAGQHAIAHFASVTRKSGCKTLLREDCLLKKLFPYKPFSIREFLVNPVPLKCLLLV